MPNEFKDLSNMKCFDNIGLHYNTGQDDPGKGKEKGGERNLA